MTKRTALQLVGASSDSTAAAAFMNATTTAAATFTHWGVWHFAGKRGVVVVLCGALAVQVPNGRFHDCGAHEARKDIHLIKTRRRGGGGVLEECWRRRRRSVKVIERRKSK
jgi:hypothetical protein